MRTQPDPTPSAPAGPLRRAGRRGAHSVRRWLAIGGLAGLASCATAPPPGAATPALPGATARLLLRGAVPPDSRFALYTLGDAVLCQSPKLLAGGTPQKPADAATVPAGTLTTLDFVVLRGPKTVCVVRWSFTPGAGKTYLVQGQAQAGVCNARLMDASAADLPVPPADAVLRFTPGQPCTPLAQSPSPPRDGSLIQGGQHNGEAVLMPNATSRDLQGLIAP